MTSRRNYSRIAILVALVAAGAFWLKHLNDDDRKRSAEKHQKRLAIAQKAEPSAKTFQVSGGQITVLAIPYTTEIDPTFVEVQRCFVWRDSVGTATMACPSQPEIALSE
jgi:hypothetical protein